MKPSTIRINWFVDFDKEERWINDMSRNGWAFWHTNGVVYRFRKCEPDEFIFQIDFDENGSREGVGDYVVFRSSCGDKFVHQLKGKIYWKRETVSGPFAEEGNPAAKLRLTNKAFNYCLNSFMGLTRIAAFAFLVLVPTGKLLPASGFSEWLTDVGCGLTYVILIVELFLILPGLKKLKRKIDEMTGQIF